METLDGLTQYIGRYRASGNNTAIITNGLTRLYYQGASHT